MLLPIKSITVAAAIAAFVIAGPGTAMSAKGELTRDIHSVLGADSNVIATVTQGTVTFFGVFSNHSEMLEALEIAHNGTGVERVINNATVIN